MGGEVGGTRGVRVEGIGGVGRFDVGDESVGGDGVGGEQIEGLNVARESVSTVEFARLVGDLHVGLEVSQVIKPACLTSR
jgi:hypothetical protein